MQPRWYQSESVEAVWNYLRNENGSPLVVLPTGAGKSLVLAMLAQQALEQWSGRTIVLAHRKELLKQNAEKIRTLMPGIDVGIYSAGLKSRDVMHDVVCAGIQSVYNKAFEFGRRDLIIVDEAHLIPDDGDGMYQTFLTDMNNVCSHARVIGLTATPYRCGTGALAGPGKMFHRICYEVGTGSLINEGFLCPLTNKPSKLQIDTSKIKMRGGEFLNSSMADVFEAEVLAACQEIAVLTQARKSVLVFCSGIQHAEESAELLRKFTGEVCEVVTGNTAPMFRDSILKRFAAGEIKYLCNCDVLTTGFDSPRIDCVAVLRATMSPGLFAQIVGRGLRLHPDKQDCLVLDFGENIKRHGSLDDPDYGRADITSDGSNAADANGRGKQCPACMEDVAVQTKVCPYCNFEFPVEMKPRHGSDIDDESTIVGIEPPKTWTVIGVRCNEHQKKNAPDAPPTLRVTYTCEPVDAEPMSDDEAATYYDWNQPELGECDDCGGTVGEVIYTPDGKHFAELCCASCGTPKKHLPHPTKVGNLETKDFSEWVCFEHDGFARTKAENWWRERAAVDCPMPSSVYEAEMLWHALRHPARITVGKDGRWDRIIRTEFDDDVPEDWVSHSVEVSDDEIPF